MSRGSPGYSRKKSAQLYSSAFWAKVGIGIALFALLLFGVRWFRAPHRSAISGLASPHRVTLTWNASISAVAGYNVYRSKLPSTDYAKVNSSLVQALSFTDQLVQSGATYSYVTRAVDAKGRESKNSNEARATIP